MIKEILKDDDELIVVYKDNSTRTFDTLTIDVIDYITNLQQEIEEYKKDYDRLYIEDCKLRENHNIDDISLLDENYKLQQDLDKANDIIAKDRQFFKCRMDEYVELKKENEFLKLNNPEQNIEHFRIVKENRRKIDNLRKENEKLQTTANNCKQENERLKEELNYTVSQVQHNQIVTKLCKEKEDYKSRCKKAIEYIYHWSSQRKFFFDKIDRQLNGKPEFKGDIADLLNILKGSDDK